MAEHPQSATLPELLDRYERHLLVVTAARTGAPVALGNVARNALGALTAASTISHGLAVERWPIVRAALSAGVSVTELGAATGGLGPDEVAAGLGLWADRRYRDGAMSSADYNQVGTLLALTRSTA